jgi:hypothetical protein
MPDLNKLLVKCWYEGSVPQEMRDAHIVTLYKNKGDRSDCNNYRGISLLSVVGKAFARVLLSRLQQLANRVYPVTMRLSSTEIYGRHDIFSSSSTGAMQRTTSSSVYCLRRPYQGV